MKKILFLSLLFLIATNIQANDGVEALQDYAEFAEYSDGSITRAQLESIKSGNIQYIDTRNKGQYEAGHIPNAINIEWREILSRLDEVSKDKTVVLYCETGLLSSKAHLMLRIAGRENVKVLWGGYLIWSARETFDESKKVKK
jgi:rhodanese-related sulfurtransferase